MADRVYQPAGQTVAAFHNSNAYARFLLGPLGSSKSSASICELIRRAQEQRPGPDGKRRTRWGVVRNTYPELISTTARTINHWLPVGRVTMSAPYTHHLVSGDVDMELTLLAIDTPADINKLLSLELTGAWLNEVRELPKAVLDMCGGRIGRFPAMSDGGPTWSGIVADSNMPDADSWLFKLAEEERPEGFEFFKQPGAVRWDGQAWKVNPDAENIANLPPDYYARQIAGKREDWIKVYLAGEYGFVSDDKAVFPEYRDSVHFTGKALLPVPGLPLIVGHDAGLTPASVVLQQTASGQWRALSEIVTEDYGAVRFAAKLKAHLAQQYPGMTAIGYSDPASGQRAQTDERTVIEILKRHTDIAFHTAPSNDFTMRREVVASALSRLVDGEPGLVVGPGCPVLRRALSGGYHFRRVQTGGDERFRDVPDKNAYSHVAEALQYALLGGGAADTVMIPRKQKGRRQQFAHGTGVTRIGGYGNRPADNWRDDPFDDRPRFAKL